MNTTTKTTTKTTTYTNDKRTGLVPFKAQKVQKEKTEITLVNAGKVFGKGLRTTHDGLKTATFIGKLAAASMFKKGTEVAKKTSNGVNKLSLNFFAGIKEGLNSNTNS